MFQKKAFLASVADNSGVPICSEEELSDAEFATQRVSRRSLIKRAGLVGLAGGVALIVAACGSTGSSSSKNGTPTPISTNNNFDSGGSDSGSSSSDNNGSSSNGSSSSSSSGSSSSDDNGEDDNGSSSSGSSSSGSSGSDDGGDDSGSSSGDDGGE